MKTRPILFRASMVRAILDGSKTQTRRIFKLKNGGVWPNKNDVPAMHQILRNCPHGQIGDRLWVRETWAAPHQYDGHKPVHIPASTQWHYAATEARGGLLWRPSIHMPRVASRITLEITSVRVERLQDISEADAIAEGVRVHPDHHGKPRTSIYSPVQAYRDLWESINGQDSWDANPHVWVIDFKKA